MKVSPAQVFTAIALALILAATQSPGQEQRQSPKSEMPPMEKMPMDAMMKECGRHQQAAMKSIDDMTKMIEGAKQSNDPAKMRAAIDQSQKQLTEMKEHMTSCRNMMNMMEKMHGMGGMMKGESK